MRDPVQRIQKWRHLQITLLILVPSLSERAVARDCFVSPNGSPSGSGTISDPIDLTTALLNGVCGGVPISPGDTVQLRGGIYEAPPDREPEFTSRLAGTQAAPITVRGYQDERATLQDTRRSGIPELGGGHTLMVRGQWTIYRDFEIRNSNTDRSFIAGNDGRPGGISDEGDTGTFSGPGNKFVNLIIHDVGVCIGSFASYGTEAYGCVCYNNGTDTTDPQTQQQTGNQGYLTYLQNNQSSPQKIIRNCIDVNSFGFGHHAYTSSSTGNPGASNITLDRNIIANAGILNPGNDCTPSSVLWVAQNDSFNAVVTNNLVYRSRRSSPGFSDRQARCCKTTPS